MLAINDPASLPTTFRTRPPTNGMGIAASTASFDAIVTPVFMVPSPTFVAVWVTIFFVTTRTPVFTIRVDVAVLPRCAAASAPQGTALPNYSFNNFVVFFGRTFSRFAPHSKVFTIIG